MNGLEIKEFRKKHKLTQEKLADIVGAKVRSVQSWEQGTRNISQSAIKLMLEYEKNPNEDDLRKKSELIQLANDCIMNWEDLMNVESFKTKYYLEVTKTLNMDIDEIFAKILKK